MTELKLHKLITRQTEPVTSFSLSQEAVAPRPLGIVPAPAAAGCAPLPRGQTQQWKRSGAAGKVGQAWNKTPTIGYSQAGLLGPPPCFPYKIKKQNRAAITADSCTDGHDKGFSQQGLGLGWMGGIFSNS